LIYFIFRYDTYVISFVFTYLMIIGGFATGVRILLERTIKGPYFEDQENSRKILGNYIFPEDSGSQKEELRGAWRGPHARVVRPDPWPRQPYVRPPWPTSAIALWRISSSPKT
jgi:hypothetical protein